MKGYNSVKQFCQDHQFLRIAKKIDPGREGETITSFMKKRIDTRLKKASSQFKTLVKNRNYSVDDLKLIATHDSIKSLHNVEFFVKESYGTNYVSPAYYKKVLSSNAFKSGRLKRLYEFIPHKLETKQEFIRFIRSRKGISRTELTVIMNQICKKDWHQWLNDLLDKNKIHDDRGRWFI